MRELFIKYSIEKFKRTEIKWTILPIEEGKSAQETVENFESMILFSSDVVKGVEIISVNLV